MYLLIVPQNCGQKFIEPCLLSCFHTLCAKCVRKVAKKTAAADGPAGATAMVPAGAAAAAVDSRDRLVVDCPICR